MKPEVLSPAGGFSVFKAALEAGADAVYLGLRCLNARNGAKNFLPEELEQAVAEAHGKNARVYLTLNTDLSQRELGTAARALALAAKCGVDAVLIRDPAYLLFKDAFPGLDFHFSTQAAVSSSAGVKMARELGITRAVLAREMSFDEIRAATAVDGIETEVFVQGAMCFCCSGRCLLSSWGGGRSGNRGTCTSPCRVAWKSADGVEAHPMSMRDLCLTDWCDALANAGVVSLKIEGRLKSAGWVSKAVTLYRHAVDHTAEALDIRTEAQSLGDYTGRDLTDGYVRGDRNYMTAVSGRVASSAQAPQCMPAQDVLRITVSSDDKNGTCWSFALGDANETLRTPPQRIANARRAVSVAETVEAMRAGTKMSTEAELEAEIGERLLPRSASNAVNDAFQGFLRNLAKQSDGLPRGVELPEAIKELLGKKATRCTENCRHLGDKPSMARFSWDEQVSTELPCIIECYPDTEADAIKQAEVVIGRKGIAGLPSVMYEHQLAAVHKLVEKVKDAGLLVEVNSWDTLKIALEIGAGFTAGPGMAVLNSLAADELSRLGAKSVYVSPEIDQGQLEDLCANAQVPLSMTVYGRIALMTTRAVLPELFKEMPFEDARGIGVEPEHHGELTVLRAARPMDWRRTKNNTVLVQNLVMDLHGCSSDIIKSETKPFLFNYDRRLR